MAACNTEDSVDFLAVVDDAGGGGTSLWDPGLSSDWDQEKPSNQCILRIKRFVTNGKCFTFVLFNPWKQQTFGG